MSVTVAPEVAALTAAIEAVATADPRATGELHRLGELEELLTLSNRLSAAIVHRVGVADIDETTITDCGRSTKAWLVEEQQLNPTLAGRIRHAALRLPHWKVLDAAFTAGQISLEHVTAILTAMKTVPPPLFDTVEAALVDLARTHTPAALGEAVDAILVACGVESNADRAAERRHDQRRFTIAKTFNGLRSVAGLLTPEVGEALERALAAATTAGGPEDDRSPAQRCHDALGVIANHHLAHADLPAVNGERPRVVVTIDYDALVRALTDQTRQLSADWATLDSGARISPATARRLACDAEIIPAVLGRDGQVLELADASRTFNTRIRRAAWIQQHGRCAYPHCRTTPTDCHHITWWTHGGPSTLTNAAWLCTFHHWLIHERGWTMRRNPNHTFTFTNAAGLDYTVDHHRHPEQHDLEHSGAPPDRTAP